MVIQYTGWQCLELHFCMVLRQGSVIASYCQIRAVLKIPCKEGGLTEKKVETLIFELLTEDCGQNYMTL